MKRSKPPNSLKTIPLLSPPKIESVSQYREFQRLMTTALFRPLTPGNRMQTRWTDSRKMSEVAGEFVKPNDRLTSFERLEIYNRQYWFRVLDSFYEDYPGLRAVLGEKSFLKLAEAYLVKYPSASFTLRNLGSRLERFLRQEPQWAGKRLPLAIDVVRFEWAQIVAFDTEARPVVDIAELHAMSPEQLSLGLQPHITLLAFDYPIDDFVLAAKRHEALRGEASNAMKSAHKAAKLNKVPLPSPHKTYVAIHRHKNAVYYKRLEPEAFALLNALRQGVLIEIACARALRRASSQVDWQEKVKGWFQDWSSLGWFFATS